MSTLSVETSSSGSSTATSSPTCLSQRVTVPSVTDSPSAGSVTDGLPPPPPDGAGRRAAAASGEVLGRLGSVSCARGCRVGLRGSAASVLASRSAVLVARRRPAGRLGLGSGLGARGSGSALGAPSPPPASEAPPATRPRRRSRASTAPTSTVSSSSALISSSVPATGEGISVSTLSVETSSSGSSTATSSPTCLSQRVTVPSVTDSPSAGRLTSVAM